MAAIRHSKSEATIEGTRLLPGEIIQAGDKFDSPSGRWELAGDHAGKEVSEVGHGIWVRPTPSEAS